MFEDLADGDLLIFVGVDGSRLTIWAVGEDGGDSDGLPRPQVQCLDLAAVQAANE